MTPERLADWEALCAYLEDCPYNASYHPQHPAAYLLTGFYSPRKTIRVDDLDAPPIVIGGRSILRQKEKLNSHYTDEKALALRCRQIVTERRSLGLVYWATGFGWRLRKDYREKLAALKAAITTP